MKYFFSFLALFISLSLTAQQLVIPMSAVSNNQTFNTCNGFIIDSGGQGGPGYSNGENVTITICPTNPGDFVSLDFNLFQLSTFDDNPNVNITNVDYMDVYDGPSIASPTLGTYTGTQLQGVNINATLLNASGCITLRFRSNSSGTGFFTASATCEPPCTPPQAAGIIVGGETQDSIRVCLGEVVNFQDFGSTPAPGFNLVSYKWDFMDGTTALTQNASHAYSIPGQYLVQLFVEDDNNCGNTNLIDLQVFVATEPSFGDFPTDTTICLGEQLNFSIDPEFNEVPWTGFNSSLTITDGCLPDTLLGVSQDIPVVQTGFIPGSTITNISDIESFCVDLEHSFMGDLVLIVQCPSGQTQILHQQGGGGTQLGVPNPMDNVDCSDPTTQGTPFTYCFTPTAPETWVDWVNNNGFGTTLPAGDYAPVQSFNSLLGCPLNGVWTMTIIDNWAADDGTIFAFDINVNPALLNPITTFEPQIGIGSDSSFWNAPAIYGTITNNADDLAINPTASGTFTYDYTIIDNFGCQYDSSVVVTVNANPTPNAGPDVVVCDGQPVQLNGTINGGGGGSPCTYSFNLDDSFGDGWNGNSLLVTVNGVLTTYTIPTGTTGNYTLAIPHGASVTVQFDGIGSFLSECSYEVLDPNGNVVLADGGNFTSPSTTPNNFTADCFGGFVFEWTPANVVSDPTIPDPIGTFTGNGTLTLTVYPTGHPLCATTDQLDFSLSASADPGNDGLATVCSLGGPIDLFPVLGPTASPNGTWSNAAGNPVTMPYDPVTMNPGIYTYEVDSNGCISSATVTVTEIVTTVTAVGTNVSCHGANNGSALVTVTNATTYSLDGGAAQAIVSSPFTISNLSPGAHTIDVNGANGCAGSVTVNITEPPALQITSISPDITICPNTSTPLSATGTGGSSAYTFTWFTPTGIVGTGSPFTVTPANTTQYCVVLTEACGSMPDTACMIVSTPTPIPVVFTPDNTNGCSPVAVNFTNNSVGGTIVSTLVDFGDGQTTTLVGTAPVAHTYENPGLYSVTVTLTSDVGCTYTSTYTNLIEVFSYPNAFFNINPNPTSMFNPTVNLIDGSSSDVVSYQWIMPAGTPATSTDQNVNVTYPEGVAGNYGVTLIVENEDGCTDTMKRVVQVITEVILFAPNTFTPDGDEFNQQWFLHIDGIDVSQFDLFIFNRWGEVVWESHDPKGAWDGTYHGKIVQEGTYTWTLETKDITTDKKYEFGGHITILR
ncbi:MAG: PKD domain-containing protein [Fluviicola sp.]|nr:PKD domain-containing protein [Fluviicola sp.]